MVTVNQESIKIVHTHTHTHTSKSKNTSDNCIKNKERKIYVSW